MDGKMSAAGLMIIASNLASFVSFILWCIIYSCIITLQDFYSCFRRIFNLLSYILRTNNAGSHDDVTTSEPCLKVEVTREDVGIVMEKLGLVKEQPLLEGSFEIVSMFDEREASLDEVREAFGVFDENNDGFIDAEELTKMMSSLGLEGLCEQECKRMIMAFDDDGDGRIDFGEFVKNVV